MLWPSGACGQVRIIPVILSFKHYSNKDPQPGCFKLSQDPVTPPCPTGHYSMNVTHTQVSKTHANAEPCIVVHTPILKHTLHTHALTLIQRHTLIYAHKMTATITKQSPPQQVPHSSPRERDVCIYRLQKGSIMERGCT